MYASTADRVEEGTVFAPQDGQNAFPSIKGSEQTTHLWFWLGAGWVEGSLMPRQDKVHQAFAPSRIRRSGSERDEVE
jgi:hypothetical protein